MKSLQAGSNTSAVEVLNISQHGLWLWLDEEECFLPFKEFPWFKQATIEDILKIERVHHDHLYWPSLDVDLHVDCMKHLHKYPLVAKS